MPQNLGNPCFGSVHQTRDFAERQVFEVVERDDGLFAFWQLVDQRLYVGFERFTVDLFERLERVLIRNRVDHGLLSFTVDGGVQGQRESALGIPEQRVVVDKRHVEIIRHILI